MIERFVQAARKAKQQQRERSEQRELQELQEQQEREANRLLQDAIKVFGEIIQAAGFEPRPDGWMGRPYLLAIGGSGFDFFLRSLNGWELGVIKDGRFVGAGIKSLASYEPDLSPPHRLALALEDLRDWVSTVGGQGGE